ncbi:pyrroline-5-carboxylate reductase [Marinobacterium zhoushanense]|uniref:Pyrroline-5-carboxylate reductase n=1 Tax=Marinobacterium zhoushanense TaxID=1679163 RepID=A0ABQ1KEH3_9GAMM|nr:pyrroline-5-carboxylate reductase [Marinobacterium zhoushanense]GGB97562.1 pyrroline-5-carboxylate reductase [Marinobacterium zhoushanense]
MTHTPNMTPTIAFIGVGNMARAIIEGLLATGYPADRLWVTARNVDKLSDLGDRGLHATSDNDNAILNADIVVLAVKPQGMQALGETHRASVQQKRPLLISVAAGISAEALERWFGGDLAVVRCMPNTPSLVQTGAAGLYANAKVSPAQKAQTETILGAVGLTLWVEQEAHIDAVTAVSGSGPAYYFLMMEAMAKAGEQLGLDAETALKLTLQTALGAARMASESELSPAELRARVTSPKGTTEQAILSFQAQDYDAMVLKAMTACRDRAQGLSEELCND